MHPQAVAGRLLDKPSMSLCLRRVDTGVVRIRLIACVGLTLVAAVVPGAVAHADGPYEPNETASQAFGPLVGQTISAALETPQDVDWYRFYARPQRQVGVLATMSAPCSRPGSIRVEVFDAEGAVGVPVVALTLGYTGAAAPVTAANATMTSQPGHRYFVKVTQTLCQGVVYTLQVAPAEDLAPALSDTDACLSARRTARLAQRRLSGLRSAMKRGHGARRAALRRRVELQQQTVTTARADQQSACSRTPLAGYPYE